MTTRPLIGTSWKMHLSASEAARYFDVLRPLVADVTTCDLFVLPPFTAIWVARDRLAASGIAWGAQDVHGDDDGAHTGDVSAAMLVDLGCRYVEVGHSERRRDHGETDEVVAHKVGQVLRHGMTPILCVGEPVPGAAAAAADHVLGQLGRCLESIERTSWRSVVVAYEPVWAIGEGARAAGPDHIGTVQRAIHAFIDETPGDAGVRVIYGGSVDESSAGDILAEDGVDGLFIGRAALDPARFAAIVRIAARTGRAQGQAPASSSATEGPVVGRSSLS